MKRMLCHLSLMLALPAIAAFQAPATPSATPAVLTPYIKDGSFSPGDYGWARGRFDDASPQDKAAYAGVMAWMKQCFDTGTVRAKAELAAMGVDPSKLAPGPYSDLLCAQVSFATPSGPTASWAAFQKNLATIRPYIGSYLLAVETVAAERSDTEGTLRDRLLLRPVAEQMLRSALSWGEGDLAEDAPKLPDDPHSSRMSLLGGRLVTEDRQNTRWLDAVVRKEGWPRLSVVGENASQMAWLLAQHADHDPAFQLRVLRMMEPLVKTGEVRRRDYGYLYDRIMLKIAGQQRYGTQMVCKAGKRIPLPLEDDASVDRLRAELGLRSMAENASVMDKNYGPCPPDH